MKFLTSSFILALCLLFWSCQDQEPAAEFTGRSLSYTMVKGSYFDQSTEGTVMVKEKIDGSVQIELLMQGTMEGASHPVHLHRGSLLEDETVAMYLSPLQDIGNQQSRSITSVVTLEGQNLTFNDFQQLDASIKVHFQETGELKNVILGATNIGKNYQSTDALRFDQQITTCNNF